MDKLLERFLNYVSLDTQSKAGVRQVPSTEGQWKLLHLLKEQLEEMGLINVTLSEKGTLMATLPANVPGDIPAIGFISHVDTSPDCSGKNVNPQIVENYRGGDIALGIGDEVLSPVMFPVLHQLLGQTLITTDGKTLLGADDKAGVAEHRVVAGHVPLGDEHHGDVRENQHGIDGFKKVLFLAGLQMDHQIIHAEAEKNHEQTQGQQLFAHNIAHTHVRALNETLPPRDAPVQAQTEKDAQCPGPGHADFHHSLNIVEADVHRLRQGGQLLEGVAQQDQGENRNQEIS